MKSISLLSLVLLSSSMYAGEPTDVTLTNVQKLTSKEAEQLSQDLNDLTEWVKNPSDSLPACLTNVEIQEAALKMAIENNLSLNFSKSWAEAMVKEEADSLGSSSDLASQLGQTLTFATLNEKAVLKPFKNLENKKTAPLITSGKKALVLASKTYFAYQGYQKFKSDLTTKSEQDTKKPWTREHVIKGCAQAALNYAMKEYIIKNIPTVDGDGIVQNYVLSEVSKRLIKKFSPWKKEDALSDFVDITTDAIGLVKEYQKNAAATKKLIATELPRIEHNEEEINKLLIPVAIENYSELYAAIQAQKNQAALQEALAAAKKA